jgi:hypothetical protein
MPFSRLIYYRNTLNVRNLSPSPPEEAEKDKKHCILLVYYMNTLNTTNLSPSPPGEGFRVRLKWRGI